MGDAATFQKSFLTKLDRGNVLIEKYLLNVFSASKNFGQDKFSYLVSRLDLETGPIMERVEIFLRTVVSQSNKSFRSEKTLKL